MTLALEPEAASIHCRRQPVTIATQKDGNKAIAGMQKGDKYVVFDQGGKIKYVDLDQQQTSKSIDGCLKYFFQKKLYV